MSGGNTPDDVPEGASAASAVSSGSQPTTNGLALDWALCDERERADQLFEALVRAVETELLRSARAMAYELLGANDVEDAISTVWVKLLARRNGTTGSGQTGHHAGGEQAGHGDSPGGPPGGFDPGRGTFRAYFFTVLQSTCYDILRRRRATQQRSIDATMGEEPWPGGFPPSAADQEDEILRRIDGIEDRITGAIEMLNISDKHRVMLRLMLGTEEAGEVVPPADSGAAAKTRQQKDKARQEIKRLRDKVAELADLTPDELKAASLVRKHHTVAAAAAAERGIDVPGLFASAKRKVFALFHIETED